jgi:hypothetical protein
VSDADPRRIIVEWRYKPRLLHFSLMDEAGAALEGDFPDWEKTPITVDLRNRQTHRRLVLGHSRTVIEMYSETNPEDAIRFAVRVQKVVARKLAYDGISRLGLRFWFALGTSQTFEALVAAMFDRLFRRDPAVERMLDAEVSDTQYVVDLRADQEGWESHFRLGPMRREQWFQVVEYDPRLFPTNAQDPESLDQLRQTVPEILTYVDLDIYRPSVDPRDVEHLVEQALVRARSRVARVSEILKQ